ncbi:hypothetical protein AA103581_2172 [Gluconobacter wancherniae NBRC 103581]|nr:hypothetical protein AA103581_2172 [Gluconobacter wancherniae NBRC 103581]
MKHSPKERKTSVNWKAGHYASTRNQPSSSPQMKARNFGWFAQTKGKSRPKSRAVAHIEGHVAQVVPPRDKAFITSGNQAIKT